MRIVPAGRPIRVWWRAGLVKVSRPTGPRRACRGSQGRDVPRARTQVGSELDQSDAELDLAGARRSRKAGTTGAGRRRTGGPAQATRHEAEHLHRSRSAEVAQHVENDRLGHAWQGEEKPVAPRTGFLRVD